MDAEKDRLGEERGVASGGIRVDARGVVTSGFLSPWATTVFPWLVGLLTLSLFALLATVYLCVEAGDDRALAADFRRRALLSMGASTFFAAAALAASEHGAPRMAPSLVYLFRLFKGRPSAAH